MIRVLLIDPDAVVAAHYIPVEQAAQPQRLAYYIGGTPERADYHPQALLHVHDEGSTLGLPANLTAWALACAWRGLDLPYLLHGPVIITGPETSSGGVAELGAHLVEHVHTTGQVVRETLADWKQRPPVSNSAAVGELLAYVRNELSAVRTGGSAQRP